MWYVCVYVSFMFLFASAFAFTLRFVFASKSFEKRLRLRVGLPSSFVCVLVLSAEETLIDAGHSKNYCGAKLLIFS